MPNLILPQLQNWSCRGCGDCCHLHEIPVTDEERQRITDQNWAPADGIPANTPLFRRSAGRWCLSRRPDGACIFLNDKGLCRIHAKFGELAKPLPCRLFPYVLYPLANSVTVSLRFSCPQAAASRGTPISERKAEIQEFCRLGAVADAPEPPPISRRHRLDWPDTLRIITRLHGMLACDDDAIGASAEGTPLALRLIHALFLTDTLAQTNFAKARGQALDEWLDAIVQAAPAKTVASLAQVPAPLAPAKLQLRMLVAQYAPRYPLTVVGLGYRLRAALDRLRMTRGRGSTPQLHASLPPVPFDDIDKPRQCFHPDIDALFARYFQTRLMGLTFCGPACYGLDLCQGFTRLALTYPVLLYLTRWSAIAAGRPSATPADAALAVTLVDHKHGYSPRLGSSSIARMTRWFQQADQLAPLCAWYAT